MVSKKSKLIFLMPPKTASNSLKESLLDSVIKFDNLEDFKLPKIHLFLSELVKFHSIENLEDYKIIQLVRDPLDKFISSYFHQLRITKNINTKFKSMDLNDFATHFFQSIKKNNFLDEFYGNDFYKNSIRNGVSWGGTRLYLNQVQWNDLNLPIHYFKLEEIKDSLEPISDLIGIYLPNMSKKNVGDKKQYEVSNTTRKIVSYVFNLDYKVLKYGTTH